MLFHLAQSAMRIEEADHDVVDADLAERAHLLAAGVGFSPGGPRRVWFLRLLILARAVFGGA